MTKQLINIGKIIFYFLITYIVLYILCLFTMKKLDRILLLSLFKHIDTVYEFSKLNFKFSSSNSIIYLIIVLLFPFISTFVPDKYYGVIYTYYPIPYILKNNNFDLLINGSSKLFCYNYFNRNYINTPKVYLTSENSKITNLNPINDKLNKQYIIKPIWGAEAAGIKNVNYDKLLQIIRNKDLKYDFLVQDFISDPFTNANARDFRIITQNCNGVNKVILIVSRSQYKKKSIITTKTNGNGVKYIPITNIEFNKFSAIEQHQLSSITKTLIKLHKKDFEFFPFIGWDVCLTNNGPYLYEINLISETRFTKEYTEYYLDEINKLYN